MENIELTKQEEGELKKRGFFVKKDFGIINLFTSICYILGYLGLSIYLLVVPVGALFMLFIGSLAEIFQSKIPIIISLIIFGILFLIMFIIPIINFIYSYLLSGMTFYTNKGIIKFGKFHPKVSSIKLKFLFFIDTIIQKLIISGGGGIGALVLGIIVIFFYSVPITTNYIHLTVSYNVIADIFNSIIFFLLLILGFILPIIVVGFILIIFRYFFQLFNPLYAFGNLGEKIQSLTPQIEQQSKEIQENFEKDMNFGVLHSGFEKLSSTFSQIISLVLKLENIEKKANKGNLFDSTKYINSLRSDILTPLISLRTFLEKQKQELMNSKKELTRVRIGGTEEESANRELASKRSESLMIELEKNITSLDEMILKME